MATIEPRYMLKYRGRAKTYKPIQWVLVLLGGDTTYQKATGDTASKCKDTKLDSFTSVGSMEPVARPACPVHGGTQPKCAPPPPTESQRTLAKAITSLWVLLPDNHPTKFLFAKDKFPDVPMCPSMTIFLSLNMWRPSGKTTIPLA